MTFTTADFIPLDSFALYWRWSQPTHNVLPAEALARIRPLRAERAVEFNTRAAELCAEARLASRLIRADGPATSVAVDLATLWIDVMTPVLVGWSSELAVLTDWGTFVSYWDDFCYPSSDDIAVCPLDASWTLCYDDHEQFRFSELSPRGITEA